MLLGVLDVGSNTIHLQVMQAHPGARPTPTTNLKTELRLTDYLDEIGNISPLGVEELHKAIGDALVHAKEFKTEEIVAFATSAIREATNGAEVIKEIGLDRIILETDAPYLTPVPHRGKRNETAYIRFVADKLAETMGLSTEEIAEITTLNSQKLFGI